jgi:hypothetical protein
MPGIRRKYWKYLSESGIMAAFAILHFGNRFEARFHQRAFLLSEKPVGTRHYFIFRTGDWHIQQAQVEVDLHPSRNNTSARIAGACSVASG